MPRPYRKTSAYWNRPAEAAAPAEPALRPSPFPDIVYGSTEVSRASAVGSSASVTRLPGVNNGQIDAGAYQNLKALPSPYSGYDGGRGDSYTGCSEAISLCAKAWAGVSICRNAVEVAVEFSSQPLYVKCKNETARVFFEEWLRAIQINRLKEQFFREYYRSGNVFLYRFDGQFGPAYYGNFQRAFGADNDPVSFAGVKSNRVPIRYELLNPTNVFVPSGVSFPYTYVRLLSTWECERLRNPITEQDRQVFKDLPPEAKEQIKNGASNPQGVYLNMQPDRLRFTFYKKQPYEPLSVPFLWPVLADIEFKLTLRKMDMRLARTIEHAILLVTNGEAPSKENGGNGINQNNIARLQNLLSNQTVGRVLVADYTTKAQWLIPDIQEILGPEKYQVVNEDIKEGLQSILSGGDKFANAQIKAQIFVQRLEEGQNAFLHDFLLPEVKQVADIMGFRTVPDIGFMPINLKDESVHARIVAQLGQLGILTAEQVVQAIETQVLPNADEMRTGQQAYKKQREDGLYQPLVGGQKEEDEGGGPNGRPAGTSGIKQSGTRTSSPIGTSKGAAALSDAFSVKAYTECLRESSAVAAAVEAGLRKRHKIKGEFNDAQKQVAQALTLKVISTQPRDKWQTSVASVLAAPPVVAEEVGAEIDEISVTHEVDAFDAALLRHCRTEAPAAA